MNAWANQSGTLNIEFLKKPGNIVTRNKDNIAGINHYYSIQADMPICTKEDADKFFHC